MAENDIGGALDLTVATLREGVLRLGIAAALPECRKFPREKEARGLGRPETDSGSADPRGVEDPARLEQLSNGYDPSASASCLCLWVIRSSR